MAMEIRPFLQQRLEQRMHLSQQMLQNLELLQLPIMELREMILEELQENPTLEEKQDAEEPEATPADAPAEETIEEEAKRESLESFEDQWFENERRTRRSDSAEESERRQEMLNNACEEGISLRDHLTEQLSGLELPAETHAFCAHVIEAIDDNGYLTFAIEDLVASLPDALKIDPADALLRKIEHALSVIQTLDPRGVGARSMKECLLLQLAADDPRTPILRKVIENHFEDIGANRLPKIARTLALDPEAREFFGYETEPDASRAMEDVKALISEISRLNPKPGASYSIDRAPKVYPEVVIKRVDGRYEIVLEDGWLPPISINRNYEEMLRERKITKEERDRLGKILRRDGLADDERSLLADLHRGRRLAPDQRDRLRAALRNGHYDEEERKLLTGIVEDRKLSKDEREFLKGKMEAGRKLISAIEQRRGTIYRITSEILKRQMDFFEEGVEHLKPMKMQEVADAVGIHLSTVSRAISEKWVETPRGIFPLKYFFASAAPKAEPSPATAFQAGEAPDEGTRLALLEKIREMVGGEDRKNPLSDLEIVQRLKAAHRITAARRTIAKYREELGIPSSRLRKQF